MEDMTGAMDVMIFDDKAQELVGAAAEELVREVTGEDISAVLCSHQSHAFVIAADKGCFVVNHILNDDELQVSSSVKMEWEGGGESSQDEVSSAPVCSSSRLV